MLYLYLSLVIIAWGIVLVRAILKRRSANKKQTDTQHINEE